MRVLSTECTEEQQKKDMPELERLHAEAMKTEMMWEFFGGLITLPNGNKYQVVDYQYEHREKSAAVESSSGPPLAACDHAADLIAAGPPPNRRKSFDSKGLWRFFSANFVPIVVFVNVCIRVYYILWLRGRFY